MTPAWRAVFQENPEFKDPQEDLVVLVIPVVPAYQANLDAHHHRRLASSTPRRHVVPAHRELQAHQENKDRPEMQEHRAWTDVRELTANPAFLARRVRLDAMEFLEHLEHQEHLGRTLLLGQ